MRWRAEMTDKLREVLDRYTEEQAEQIQFINESMLSSLKYLIRMAFMDGVLYEVQRRRNDDA